MSKSVILTHNLDGILRSFATSLKLSMQFETSKMRNWKMLIFEGLCPSNFACLNFRFWSLTLHWKFEWFCKRTQNIIQILCQNCRIWQTSFSQILTQIYTQNLKTTICRAWILENSNNCQILTFQNRRGSWIS